MTLFKQFLGRNSMVRGGSNCLLASEAIGVASEIAATGAPEIAATGAPEIAATGAPEIAATGAPEIAATGAPEIAATGAFSPPVNCNKP